MLSPAAKSFSEANKLLANLSADDTKVLASATRTTRLERGMVLSSRTEPATDVWFPEAGLISLSFTDNEGDVCKPALSAVKDALVSKLLSQECRHWRKRSSSLKEM